LAAEAAREAGNSPNTIMAASAAIIGPKTSRAGARLRHSLIDLFAHSGLLDPRDEAFDCGKITIDESTRALFSATAARLTIPVPRP
jgi:hypothetical protein